MLEIRVIGDLDGFVIGVPNKHMERLVDFQNLLHQRYRSLFLVPSLLLNTDVSERRGLSAFSTNLSQNHEVFDIKQI
jgi:hypothetical protein